MKETLIIAGFGGQGVLSMGKILAYSGVMQDYEVTWMPSYGPEMRGGTANCSVCISDEPIGSPLITAPNYLIAMNLPSLERFIDAVEPGGTVILDSSLIDREIARTDITVHRVPSSKMAEDNGINGLSNMILVGKLFHELGFCSDEVLDQAVQKCIPAGKAAMLELNRKAVALGARQ